MNKESYLSFYKQYMDSRVHKNPKTAPTDTASWENNGIYQLAFLQSEGLLSQHYLLDYGCGTLSLGNQAIPYLNAERYIGLDLSQKAINAGIQLVGQDLIIKKKAQFIITETIDFTNIVDKVDYLMAFSVINHMPLNLVSLFFSKVAGIMSPKGKIYVTAMIKNKNQPVFRPDSEPTSFQITWASLQKICEQNNLFIQPIIIKHSGMGQASLTLFKITKEPLK